jgi:hypothetical protein
MKAEEIELRHRASNEEKLAKEFDDLEQRAN